MNAVVSQAVANTLTPYQQVSLMNTAFSNPYGDSQMVNFVRVAKQCKNIADEFDEMQVGIIQQKVNQVRDAICDILVFTYGAFHLMGIDGDEASQKAMPHGYPVTLGVPLSMFGNHATKLRIDIQKKQLAVMHACKEQATNEVQWNLSCIVFDCIALLGLMGVDWVRDMTSVVDGVMTRFCRDEAELDATVAFWAAKGVTQVYFEGEYPRKIIKSYVDQPDAPQGKFLKSTGYQDTVFYELPASYPALIFANAPGTEQAAT